MSVTPSIQQRVREDIVSGALPFGARVTIDELATRYGVSQCRSARPCAGLTGSDPPRGRNGRRPELLDLPMPAP